MKIYLLVLLVLLAVGDFQSVYYSPQWFRNETRQNNRQSGYSPQQEFDFIVVGSGPAGCAAASRLSEVTGWKVLLLEAGTDAPPLDVPILSTLWQLFDYNWRFRSEKEEGACLGLVDKVCPLATGRAVGGGSVINGLLYTRGNPKDFDLWSSLGNPGWSYREVLPYFLKSERMTIPELTGSPYHGTEGPVNVEKVYASPIFEGVLEAAKILGYPLIDYNNPNSHIGFSQTQVNLKRGRRFSAATAYITPIGNRKNFRLIKNAFVTKILIDPNSKRAYGVEYLQNRRKYTVYARKEVIVSAGAYNSPKLLMLSGIGPAEHLSKMKIPVIQDLRVGDNLQEHLTTFVTFVVNTTGTFTFTGTLRSLGRDLASWLVNGTGPLASVGCDGLGYIKTQPGGDPSVPDVELMLIPTSPAADWGVFYKNLMGVPDATYNAVYESLFNREAYSIFATKLYPESRGKVRLRSADPTVPPKITGNFFSHPRDMKVLVDGIQFAVRLGQSKPMERFGAVLHSVPVPKCSQLSFGSDEYWSCAARQLPVFYHHHSCTCAMGPDPKKDVVNPRLQVHGVANLRVADTSIMPTMTAGHPMAPAYMIGEKVADFIKQDWTSPIKT